MVLLKASSVLLARCVSSQPGGAYRPRWFVLATGQKEPLLGTTGWFLVFLGNTSTVYGGVGLFFLLPIVFLGGTWYF